MAYTRDNLGRATTIADTVNGLTPTVTINYQTFAFEKDNFFVIVASGNNRDRTAYLTVFEVLAPDHRLRLLHQTQLLNGCGP
jgi:hypothetical protein